MLFVCTCLCVRSVVSVVCLCVPGYADHVVCVLEVNINCEWGRCDFVRMYVFVCTCACVRLCTCVCVYECVCVPVCVCVLAHGSAAL